VTIGTEWQAATDYTIGQQIFYKTNLYTVTVAGTSGSTAPTFVTGSQVNGSATLSYAGTAATGTAVINSQLTVVAVEITNEGSGYTTMPTITFASDSGSGAQASAVMGNNLVRSMNMTIKYDRYEYVSTVTDWTYLAATYPAGSQVRYLDSVWQATTTITNTPTTVAATGTGNSYELTLSSSAGLGTGLIVTGFGIPAGTVISQYTSGNNTVRLSQALLASVANELVSIYSPFIFDNWTAVPAGDLSGINRTQGYYQPTETMPGRNLPLLIDGLTYPGVQVYGVGFARTGGYDVDNYDSTPYDLGALDVGSSLLDAVYASEYTDVFLGTRATDINVDGGGYIDTFSSYAPEELVPGSEFDTLDFLVITDSGEAEFRIFQDMRGVQATYRVTAASTTELTAPVGIADDVIHVANASALGEPNFAADFNINFVYHPGDVVIFAGTYFECISETTGTLPTNTTYWTPTLGSANIWGIVMIGAERIMYRHRDTEDNTVSGLLRGTAGTAVATHTTGTAAYDMSRANIMPLTCQNYIESNVTYPLQPGVNQGNGSTTVFVTKIDTSLVPADIRNQVVEVYLGGERIQTGYTITNDAPVTVTFDVAPPLGVEVTIQVRRAHTWYNLATPELPLSETDTACARFLRGQ
jgi:hypothetical protein